MKKNISLIYRSLIIILAIFGVLVQIGVFSDTLKLSNLNYYTLISNLICAVYFSGAIIYDLKHIKDKENNIFCPIFKSATTMGITVTMLIVITLLKGKFPTSGLLGLSFIILHYIVPIMVILDWLIFDKKGMYKKYYPLTNLILPTIYYFYIVIFVHLGFSFGIDSMYPYPFQDVFKLGYFKVITTDIIILIFFIGLGYLYYFLDHKLIKKS